LKLSYTHEEIERWRDKVHRRRERLAVRTKEDALRFVNDVGFCFAFKTENSELPCLWNAASGLRTIPSARHRSSDPFLSFVWRMKKILPAEAAVFYSKVLKRRPTMISREFFPYFYTLSQRTGLRDDYQQEYRRGNLSPTAKAIMDALRTSSPQVTRGLRIAVGCETPSSQREFGKAMTELQARFFVVRVAEHYDPFTFEWNTVDRAYPREVRMARKIRPEVARRRVLQKYFENQLVSTVQNIRSIFGWNRQVIFETLGHLIRDGVVVGGAKVSGKDSRYYVLVS
jgi:hypothetical protein